MHVGDAFEPALPATVRALLAAGARGEGPAARWLAEEGPSSTYSLLRGVPPLPALELGWLVGIGLHGPWARALGEVMVRERIAAPAPHALVAWAAGVAGGLRPDPKAWKTIEKLVELAGELPAALQAVLAIGSADPSAVTRAVAQRLAARSVGSAPAVTAARDAPLRARSKAELEVAWLARAAARDPADVDVLLGTPWPGAWKAALARVRALREFAPDARIAAAMPGVAARYPSWAAQEVRGACAATARVHGTAAAPAPPAAADLAELWAQHRARPLDLELRAVLADALQTAGDPRGEYIALELAPTGGTAARRRAAALLAAHVDTWSAGIPGAIKASRRFERGFLAAVECKTTAAALLASAAAPAWATVEELALASDFRSHDSPLAALTAVLAATPVLEVLVWTWWGEPRTVFELPGTFPQVRALGVGSLDGADLARAQVTFPQLALVGMPTHDAAQAIGALAEVRLPALLLVTTDDLAAAIPAAERALAQASGIDELRLGTGRDLGPPVGWLARIPRGERRATLAWTGGKYVPGSLTVHATALASAGRRELAIWLPPLGRAAARAEAEALTGVTVAYRDAPLARWR